MRWTQEDLDNYQNRPKGLTPATPMMPACLVPKAKPSKYGNRKVVDATGAVHDSGKEFRRWQELELLAKSGAIAELRRQVPFALVVNGVLVARYIADFTYFDGKRAVIEDVKSPPTRKLEAYRMKVRLMQSCHGLQVTEI